MDRFWDTFQDNILQLEGKTIDSISDITQEGMTIMTTEGLVVDLYVYDNELRAKIIKEE